MTDWTQITLRLLHIFAGVFWAGTLFFVYQFLAPALGGSGAAGDIVVQQLMLKRKMGIAIPMTALLTVLTGAAMYWRNISLSSGAWAHSRAAGVYGLGAFTGIVSLIVGGTMIGPGFQAIIKIQLESQTGGTPLTPEQMNKIGGYRRRIGIAMRITTLGLAITVITMAIGRYM